jgi:hypothetical protein
LIAFPAEDAAPAIRRRALLLLRDQVLHARTRCTVLELSALARIPEIPAEISIDTTGWLITFAVAIVFLAIVVIVSYWFR